jgi:hypothetical protein
MLGVVGLVSAIACGRSAVRSVQIKEEGKECGALEIRRQVAASKTHSLTRDFC